MNVLKHSYTETVDIIIIFSLLCVYCRLQRLVLLKVGLLDGGRKLDNTIKVALKT